MTDDRADAMIVRWTPEGGASRRIVFEPRVYGYYRREEVWTEGAWREIGCEVVASVAVEIVPPEAVDGWD